MGIENRKAAEDLEKAQCSDNSNVQYSEFHDCTIDGVTYRVWSAFLGKTEASDNLANLMLRSLESGEEIGEVTDWHQDEIDRKVREALEVVRLAKKGRSQTEDEFDNEIDDEVEQSALSM